MTAARTLASVQLLLGNAKAVGPALAPALRVLEEGELRAVSLSLLEERVAVYSLLARAAARIGDAAGAAGWSAKLDSAAAEAQRRSLGGPLPDEERARVREEFRRAGL